MSLTDLPANGMLAIYGRRPGTKDSWKGPNIVDETLYQLSYTTTPEAIKKVLPAPLEPIPDAPPKVSVFAAQNRHWRLLNGTLSQYVEVGFFVPCQYKSRDGKLYKGLYPMWVLMDGSNGDKTEGAELGLVVYRESTGWMKGLGNVRMGGTGNQLIATCDVRGVRIMTLEIKTPEEISAKDLPSSGMEYFLFVKEIPNCTFTGYDVRKVIGRKLGYIWGPDNVSNVRRGVGKVTLGELETHPVSILECVETGPAYQLTFRSTPGDFLDGYFEIDDLLKD